MKRVGYLFERIATFDNLRRAAHLAGRAKKSRGSQAFRVDLEPELLRLEAELQIGTYRPGAYTSFALRDPKPRIIHVAPFRDRVLHHAICRVLGPILDASLIHDTYACRTGKGSHAAVKRAQFFARRASHVLKCDVRRFFDSVDHQVLETQLAGRIRDARLLQLLSRIIASAGTDRGLPLGNLTSQYFANSYLSPLDHRVKEVLRIKGYTRYMDDFLLFGERNALREALKDIRVFLRDVLRLELKDQVTRLQPVSRGFPFLGFMIWPTRLGISARRWRSFACHVRGVERQLLAGECCEHKCADCVRAMVAHVAHADTLVARRRLFMSSLALG